MNFAVEGYKVLKCLKYTPKLKRSLLVHKNLKVTLLDGIFKCICILIKS